MELLESEKNEMEKKLALADNNYNQMLEESAQKKIELLIKERGLLVLSIVLIERKKNVNAHNYGQWIGVEKDLSVIEPHTIYFLTIFEQF